MAIKIDCADCLAPADSCDDCLVSAILGTSDRPILNSDEQAALAVLAASDLVPPLRLVTEIQANGRKAA